MIPSSKLMLTFVWNSHGFQVIDAMAYHTIPKGEMFMPPTLSEIFSPRSLPGVEREVKGG
jgi:hypothetical protein